MSEKITVHAYDWTVEDKYTLDERLAIHVWCLDRESNPYLLRIEDFPVFCHVELPLFVNGKPFSWTSYHASEIFEWIKRSLHDHAPERFRFEMAPKLYYYRRGRKYPFMLVTFKSIEAMRHAEYFLSKAHRIEGFGTLAFNVWETNISPVRKLLTQINMQYCQWFEVEADLVPESDRISTLDREYIIKKWRNIRPISGEITKSWLTKPRIVSIDIETYSHKIHAMPSKFNALDVVNVISVIYQRSGDSNSRKRYGLVLGECNDISPSNNEDKESYSTILKYNNEVDLINGMSKLIMDLDPEVIIGYNNLGFDYPYLDHRLKRKMKEWLPMGRIRGKIPKMTTLEWQSSAFSFNSINMIHMDGRISIDIYPLIKRDNKFEEYGLGFVAQQFLGRTKHDVKAEEQFLIYKEFKEAKEKYEASLTIDNEHKDKEKVEGPTNSLTNVPEEQINIKLAYQKAIEKMTKFVAYCIQDSDLVIDLFEHNKMKYWISLIEMSNIMGVTITDLFLRGQQVRCMSLFYNIATQKGIIIDKREQPIVKFSGGFVYEPEPGCHENILCFDFASLYPSIIQAFNICLSTLVDPTIEKEIPDENCHIFDFDQEEDDDDDEEDVLDADKKKENIAKKHYHYKFVKREIQEGLLPQLERTMVAERAAINAQLKGKKDKVTGAWIVEPEKDPLIQTVLDKRQLAIKQTCNSFFGFLGVQEGGKLPLIEGAMCITAKGRELINRVNEYLKDKYKARIVYNDSVTGETPVLIKYDNVALYDRIDSILHFGEHIDQNLSVGDGVKEYYKLEHREDGKDEIILHNIVLNVWSDKGWTPIKRIIRHETSKAIYRIITSKGYVDVTEDHSLIRENGQICSPQTVKLGDALLTAPLPDIPLFNGSEDDVIEDTLLNEAIKYYDYARNGDYPYINARERVAVAHGKTGDNRIIGIKYMNNVRQYVYDLETENHHFAAGVGELIVHNTDSSMVDLGITDPKDCNAKGEHLAAEISALFPPPLRIEFEKAMRLLCFKKKKYAAVLIDKEGNHMFDDKDILKRGIVLARRDNCKWVRSVYMQILKCILTKRSLQESMDILIDNVYKLITNQIPYKELVFTRELGANYKSDNYFMKVYSDELRRKGQIVNPGDRLQFLIIKGEDKSLLGLRMCRPDMYIESLNTHKSYELDYLYYMEHALMNPIDQLISVGYKKDFLSLPSIGYKPSGRYKFRAINEPVEMMVRMLIDGVDVRKVKNMLMPVVHKGPRLNIISALKTTDVITEKKSRLRIIPKATENVLTLQ